MHIAGIKIANQSSHATHVTERHFGSNMLFHTDRVSVDSDFTKLISHLGVSVIRYPGGTISEQFFDLANPNTEQTMNYLDILDGKNKVETRTVLPFNDYLKYIDKIEGTPTIVLPTYRYFDQNNRSLSDIGKIQIRDFVVKLVDGYFGPTNDAIIEIGNEWYQKNFNWTVDEFGSLQAEIAHVVSSALNERSARDTMVILAQTGQNDTEHDILASYFDGQSSKYIDGVLTHIYGTNSSGNPLGIGGGAGARLDSIRNEWGPTLGDDFLLAVTEWNVGESGELTSKINGIMRLAPLLRLYSEMISSEVDIAHIWSTQTWGPAGLSNREGQGDSYSPTGYFFDLIKHGTLGTEMIDGGGSFRILNQKNEHVGYNYSFRGLDHVAIYLTSGVSEVVSLNVDYSNFQQQGAYVYFSTISAAPGDTGTNYWSKASIGYLTNINFMESHDGGWWHLHELGPYELVQVHISYGVGISIDGDLQNEIDDELEGTSFSDTLSGNLGNDMLHGREGNDWLSGGKGDDQIQGGDGDDTIFGGIGNDSLYGDSGSDLIKGGTGSDHLFGGAWHDTIWGDDGDDIIAGGAGNDVISGVSGANTIMGDSGDDLIHAGTGAERVNGGLGSDTLSFTDFENGVSIWDGVGIVETSFTIERNTVLQYAEIEAVEGSQYADAFRVVRDGMSFLGGAGEDIFEVLGGSQVNIEMGFGDDTVYIFGDTLAKVDGGHGDDTFIVHAGSSWLAGGGGNDHLVLSSSKSTSVEFGIGDGHDSVSGFNPDLDLIVFNNATPEDVSVIENDRGTQLILKDVDSILLLDSYFTDAFEFFSFG